MPEENLSRLTKQGNPNAIAVMLNRSLQAKNITAKVNRQEDSLQILLESANVPQERAMVSFIQKGLTKLGVTSIKTVKVYCRQTGDKSISWSQTFEIVSQVETLSSIEQIDIIETPLPPTDNTVSGQFEPEDETPSNTEQINVEDLLPGANFAKVHRRVSPQQNTPSSTRVTGEINQQTSPEKSGNSRKRKPLKPISIENVFSTVFRLYLDRFNLYFGLSFQAFLWTFIPIYGWAKAFKIQAIIARQFFSQLVGKPESINTSIGKLYYKFWDFFLAQFFIHLIIICAAIVAPIVVKFTFSFFYLVIPGIFSINRYVEILAIISPLWFSAHFFIAELPLALENEIGPRDCLDQSWNCISRSWKLSEGFVWRILGIITVAKLIHILFNLIGVFTLLLVAALPLSVAALPLSMIVSIFTQTSKFILFSDTSIDRYSALILLFLNILIMPFWQAVKAVIYYDLRIRKEGLGLQLVSDREITENS